MHYNRNEQYQEELWKISCELLKDWMSPEIWEKYGPSKQNDNDTMDADSNQSQKQDRHCNDEEEEP